MKFGLIFALVVSCWGQVSWSAIDPFVSAQKIEFNYKVVVPSKKGSVQLWVPYPAENKYQKVQLKTVKARPEVDLTWTLNTETRYGNKMIHFDIPGEVVKDKTLEITLTYIVERKPSTGFDLKSTDLKSSLKPDLYLKHNQWVASNKTIRDMAKEATLASNGKSEDIKALYDYVYKVMRYNKDGEGWGKGDPIWACSTKRGNCTDFHSLYLSMARGLGISARFEIGVPIPSHMDEAVIPGYHCWAQAFDPAKGWIPFDASEAKKAGKKNEYFGHLPSDRVLFTVGRDLTLNPPQKAGSLNYFIYPYAEANGKKLSKLDSEFSFKRK